MDMHGVRQRGAACAPNPGASCTAGLGESRNTVFSYSYRTRFRAAWWLFRAFLAVIGTPLQALGQGDASRTGKRQRAIQKKSEPVRPVKDWAIAALPDASCAMPALK